MNHRKPGIRALLAKAKVFQFDLECPYCSELLTCEADNGSYCFAIYEECPAYIKCSNCEKTSRVPKRVPSAQINGGAK